MQLAAETLIGADYNELYANTTAVMGFLSCDTVHPIYVELAHERGLSVHSLQSHFSAC